MTEPNDHELEQYLKGGSALSRRYRDASQEKAPAKLDEQVLALACAEVRRKPRANPWLPSLALAASAILAVNLAWNLREQAVPTAPQELGRLGEESLAPAATPEPQAKPAALADAPPQLAKRREAPPREADSGRSDMASDAAGAVAAYESKDEEVAAARSAVAEQERSARMNQVTEERSQQALSAALAAASDSRQASEEQAKGKATEQRKHGWWLTGSARLDYGIGLASHRPHTGSNSLVIVSKRTPPPRGYGALMHRIPAAPFRGHPVLFEAWLRTEGVTEWAGLWLRLDDASGRVLRLDNMHDRPIRGDQDWQPRYIILDVPTEAEWINFGVTLRGNGRVFIDTAHIESLTSDDAADTASARSYDFEERQLEH